MAGIGKGLYVERMVTAPLAELLVGITRDPPFGLVMTLGSGGELVEMLRDTATLLLPATRSEIEAALLGLRSAPLLPGYRGRRSEKRRVGQECVSTCRSRWSP